MDVTCDTEAVTSDKKDVTSDKKDVTSDKKNVSCDTEDDTSDKTTTSFVVRNALRHQRKVANSRNSSKIH